jgi:hypothetical protein
LLASGREALDHLWFETMRRAVDALSGDDEAREVVEHGAEIIPAPARDLEVGEVGLPELVGRRGLMFERLDRLDDDIGRTGDEIVCFQQPIDRSL